MNILVGPVQRVGSLWPVSLAEVIGVDKTNTIDNDQGRVFLF